MLPMRPKSSGFGTASRTISRVGLPARHRLGEGQRQPEIAVAEPAREFAQLRLLLDPLARQAGAAREIVDPDTGEITTA